MQKLLMPIPPNSIIPIFCQEIRLGPSQTPDVPCEVEFPRGVYSVLILRSNRFSLTLRSLALTNVLVNTRWRGHVDIATRIYPAAMASATVETAQNISLPVQDAKA